MNIISNHYVKYSARLEQINEMAINQPNEFIKEVEIEYHKVLEEVALKIELHKSKIVMLSGPSSSGKTTTAYLIKDYIEKNGNKCEIISLDDFFLGSNQAPKLPNGRYDYESLYALNLEKLDSCLENLIYKNECNLPIFNFNTGKPEEFERNLKITEGDVVIFEGIHALNPYVTRKLPLEKITKMYISVKQGISDCDSEIISAQEMRLIRRMVRDKYTRSTEPTRTLTMWEDVCRGERLYIQPFKRSADITINSIHLYEPCILRDLALPLFDTISETEPHYKQILKLKSAYERIQPISVDKLPENSLLKEFVKF